MTCEWCVAPVHCGSCPEGTYHMHVRCYPAAVQAGYFDRTIPASAEIPVRCPGGELVHTVKGYRKEIPALP